VTQPFAAVLSHFIILSVILEIMSAIFTTMVLSHFSHAREREAARGLIAGASRSGEVCGAMRMRDTWGCAGAAVRGASGSIGWLDL
jgi:hypothetical protein